MASNNQLNQNSTQVPVPFGGTGVGTMTTAYAPVCAGTTATGNLQVASTGLSTSGWVLTSTGASSLPTFQAPAAGGGMTWSEVAGTSQAAAVNNAYIIGNAALTTVTLPATAAIGDMIRVQGKGAAGWKLTANTGQTIKMGAATTTSAGSLQSTNLYDAIQVVCITANTTWANMGAVSAGLTVT